MTIKLLLLKSGENVISDIKEMIVGDEENPKVIGYFLTKPCVVNMSPPKNDEDVPSASDETLKAAFQVTLFPWMPLTKDQTIPISTDWVITIVNPTDKLEKMYIEDVLSYGKEDGKNSSTNEQSDSDQSD